MWRKAEEFTTSETIIGPSVHLEGNFTGQGNVQVAGSLSGSLQTSGGVQVEKGARVNANINAKIISIAGEVHGDVKAGERLELAASARLFGNIETRVLVIEEGAVLNGKCNMKNGLKSEIVKEPAKETK